MNLDAVKVFDYFNVLAGSEVWTTRKSDSPTYPRYWNSASSLVWGRYKIRMLRNSHMLSWRYSGWVITADRTKHLAIGRLTIYSSQKSSHKLVEIVLFSDGKVEWSKEISESEWMKIQLYC